MTHYQILLNVRSNAVETLFINDLIRITSRLDSRTHSIKKSEKAINYY